MNDYSKLKVTSKEIAKELQEVNNELGELEKLVENYCATRLEAENQELKDTVKKLKNELIKLEIENGIEQVATPVFLNDGIIPCVGESKSELIPGVPCEPPAKETASSQEVKKESRKKEKPDKGNKNKEETEKTGSGDGAGEPQVDVSRLDIRVGKVVDVKKHPDADKLYVEEIDVGQEKPLTVVSGLVNYVTIEEMSGRMVVLLCNMKPVKMRGITSEAMVMCASTPEKVEVLSPPPGSVPGDLVQVVGYPRTPDTVLNPKKKVFETVAPDLKTDSERKATYRGALWNVPGKGEITSQSLADVNIK